MSPSSGNFFRRLVAGTPLLVTVVVHLVLAAVAGYFVVSEQFVEKKKTFEAAAASGADAQKQVEHRLQVARRGGGSASSSPVSSARILSTAQDALQLVAMPELPSGALSGAGFGSGFGGVGAGSGYNTALGSGPSLGGRGFMSMSFLGITNQHAGKVVFVVDIGPGLMDIRKGGFRAFSIMRAEITRLIGALPPSNEFNVVLFENHGARLFSQGLAPANNANKIAFFEWIKPINADPSSLGGRSIPSASPRWSFTRDEKLKLDADYIPPVWVEGIQAALEQKPDTVFVITGSASPGRKEASEADLLRRHEARKKHVADLVRQGYDLPAIAAARSRALAKLRADFDAINRQLLAQKRDPFVIQDIARVLAPDFQAAIKRAGFTLTLDTTGWCDKAGRPMWDAPGSADAGPVATSGHVSAEFTDVLAHVTRLQHGLLGESASLNLFLFSGEDEPVDAAKKNLSTLASRNKGKFSLLTTRRLEQLAPDAP